jgi:glycosyltransferase involved in cell wall biosynthesis
LTNLRASLTGRRILFLVAEDWLFVLFRLGLARELVARGAVVGVGCRLSDCQETFRREGLKTFAVPFARETLSPVAVGKSCLVVRRLLREFRPHLVHLVALRPVLVGWMASLAMPRPPFVNAITGLGSMFAEGGGSWRLAVARGVSSVLFRWAFRQPQAYNVFQNSEDLERFVGRGYSPLPRSCLIRGSGVEVAARKPEPEPSCDQPVVLYAGRLLRDKGLKELLEASVELRRRNVPHLVRILGKPDYCNPTSFTAEEVKRWESEFGIEYLGWREDVLEQMNQAHVVVLPSYREGLPKCLLEAGVAERAVVACDVVGSREVIRHEENGLLAKPRDALSLADALQRVLSDEPLRRRLARRHREVVCAEFSLEQVNRQFLDLYARALRDFAPDCRS